LTLLELFDPYTRIIIGKDLTVVESVTGPLLGAPLAQPDPVSISQSRKNGIFTADPDRKVGALYDRIADSFSEIDCSDCNIPFRKGKDNVLETAASVDLTRSYIVKPRNLVSGRLELGLDLFQREILFPSG
jgi:hypothetical protein